MNTQFTIRQILTATTLVAAICVVAIADRDARLMVPYFAGAIILSHWPAMIPIGYAVFKAERKFATALCAVLLIPLITIASLICIPWSIVPNDIEFWANGMLVGLLSSVFARLFIRTRNSGSEDSLLTEAIGEP